MKKLFTYLIFLIIALILYNTNAAAKETVRTAVHIISYSNGSGGISAGTAQEAIDTLNAYFSNTNIKFVIDTIIYINDDNYANLQVTPIDCKTAEFSVPGTMQNSLNIYFAPNIPIAPGVTLNVPGRNCAVRNSAAIGTSLAHEVGHCLGLFHPDEICNGYERVIRTYEQGCYPNCSTAGDLICDTPAERNLYGPANDDCGTQYPITNPNYGNIMDIQCPSSARYYFTHDQIQKMEYTLDYNLSDIIFYVSVMFANKINNTIKPNTTLHVDGDLVNSGGSKSLLYGIGHTSKTDNEIININFKHHDWDNDFNQFKLVEGFNINKNHLERTANFLSIDPINIKNSMTEVSNSDLGTKQLRDPWWVNPSGNQPDDFRTLSSPNVNIFLNQSGPPLWNSPYYSVQAISPQTIHLSQTGKDHKFYFQNWSGSDVTFEDANSTSTGVVFTNSSAVATANFKATQLSNNTNAYSYSGQRKFIRTPDGYLHNVYESLGHVWYELSTDNGATWQLLNYGKPLDNGEGKSPSIDYVVYYDPYGSDDIYWTVVTYQEKYGSGSKIRAKSFVRPIEGFYSYEFEKTIATLSNESYSNPMTPVTSIDVAGNITWVWRQGSGSAGLYCRTGNISVYSLLLYGSSNVKLTGTSSSSYYPSITVTKQPNSGALRYIVWEDNHTIKYSTLNGTALGTIETPSGSYAEKNYKPSIVFYLSQQPVIVWQGLFDTGVIPVMKMVLKIKYSFGWSDFWDFEYGGYSSIECANINNDSIGRFVAAWGGDGNDEYITSNSAVNIYSLSTSGDVQVSNAGSDMGDIKITSFDKSSSVKDFTTLTLTQGISKKNSKNVIISKGIIASYISGEDTAVYMFDIGGIEVDGNRNLFNDSFKADSLLNKSNEEGIVETKSFLLTDNSSFTLQTNYSSRLSSSFTNDKLKDLGLKFKVNLIDAETGKVLEELSISPVVENINKYKTLGYTINTDGIGNKEVKLRLEIESAKSINTEIFTSISTTDSGKINKENFQQITLKGDEIVKDYALFQNYPNPFNPSTTISYQIPKDGFVTLKIYDVLGREITTLVNEFETKGKYNSSFNAENLASGVYLYQLKVNEFSSTKKLILLR